MIEIREAGEGEDAQIAALWTEAYCGPGAGQRRGPYMEGDVEDTRREGTIYVGGSEKVEGAFVYYPPGSPSREAPTSREAELTRLAVAAPNLSLGFARAPARDETDSDGERWVFVCPLRQT